MPKDLCKRVIQEIDDETSNEISSARYFLENKMMQSNPKELHTMENLGEMSHERLRKLIAKIHAK